MANAVPTAAGFEFVNVGITMDLGHITVAASRDLHKNCGKVCGNRSPIRVSSHACVRV
jgi:hypothetical protein